MNNPDVQVQPELESPQIGPNDGLDAILARANARLDALAASDQRVIAPKQRGPHPTPTDPRIPPPPSIEEFRYLRGQVLRNKASGVVGYVDEVALQRRPWSWYEGGKKRTAPKVAQAVVLLRVGRAGAQRVTMHLATDILAKWQVVDPATGEPRVGEAAGDGGA